MKRRIWQWMVLALTAASIVEQLRKPPHERTWHGRLFGIVPYDWRPPTLERIRAAIWNPNDPRLFTDHPFGIGWTINLYRVRQILSGGSEPGRGEPARPVAL